MANRTTRNVVASIVAFIAAISVSATPAHAGGGQAASGPSAPAPVTRSADPGHVPVWAADFMAGVVDVSRERAIRQARDFDLIVALKGTYAEYVADMKAANPDLTLLVYLNGVMAQSNEGGAYPDGWYATDANDHRVRSLGFGNYLMRPDQPGWIADVADRCDAFMSESGYDGCFLDVLGTAPLSDAYVTSVPVDPRTGRAWTSSEWLSATRRIADVTRELVAPAAVFGNGLTNGARYFADVPSSSLLDGLDGAMAETFVRDPTAPAEDFRGRWEWREDVRMLTDVASRDAQALSMTKVWTDATSRQRTALQRYALGTFLLGYQPGQGYFSFRAGHGLTRYRPIWSVDLGDPLGPAHRIHGAFVRRFENGLVVVNPTATRIRLGSSAFRGSGIRRAAQVVLGAHSASILTHG